MHMPHIGIAGHPAVKAVCPMYIFLDIYRDVGFIGGLHLSGFIRSWETYVLVVACVCGGPRGHGPGWRGDTQHPPTVYINERMHIHIRPPLQNGPHSITSTLDRNRLPDIFVPWLAWFSIDGVQPVTHAMPAPGEAEGGSTKVDRPAALLRTAIREHRDNWR